MTILEAVLATLLLGLLSTATLTVFGAAHRQNAREQQRLGAVELASRLIAMYLDDPDTMPSRFQPLGYGPYLYRYRLDVGRVEFQDSTTRDSDGRQGGGAGMNRLQQVSVHVWLGDQPFSSAGDAPDATLTRLVDPLNIMRNPDSADNMINTETGQNRLIRQLLGLDEGDGAPAGPAGAGRSRGSTGRPGGRP